MQDVIDRVKTAEARAKEAEDRLNEHEREAAGFYTRVAVLESRYTDLKTSLDGVVATQGAQGERLTGLVSEVKGVGKELGLLRDDLKTVTNRVWAGSAAGAGGTGAAALLVWFFTQRPG